ENLQVSRKLADVMIRPDLEGFTSLDFGKASELIPLGRRAASDQMQAIRQLLAQRGISLPSRIPPASLLPGDFDAQEFAYSPSPLPIQSVEVSGNEKYPAGTVLKHTRIRAGQSASIGEIDQDVSAIYGSDLFDSAGFRLQKTAAGPSLTFEVDESARTHLGLGLRYDKDYQFTGALEVLSRQVGGGRFDFLSRLLVGNVQQVYLALDGGSYSGRRLFASTFFQFRSFDRLLFSAEEQTSDFQDRRIGWGIGLHRLIGSSGRLEAGYSIERADIQRGSGSFRQPAAEILAGVSAAFRWDSFDHSDFPGQGRRAQLQVDWRDRALGSDFSFLRLSAGLEQRLQIGECGTLGVGATWKVIEGGAPFYELLYSGSLHYFDFVADPFVGLRRDERVSKQRFILNLSYRHRLKSFQLGVLRDAYLEGIYNGGLFGRSAASRDLTGPLHGFGFGASLDVRFLGPVRVLLGKTDETGWTSYFSIGYGF
ncbi:MAG: BamA/TamA family outer membrane protein, partial [Acidobacteriota bacterium]